MTESNGKLFGLLGLQDSGKGVWEMRLRRVSITDFPMT